MGETRVDLQHLLEDLRDAYTGALEETILTEVVANALDSGARRIQFLTRPHEAALTVIDDGRGMRRQDLARYHDVAASTKSRGEGIGFAGVGIKLGLLVSSEVVTETRRVGTHVATRWHLASRYRAPWKWIPPPGLTTERGTAIRLALTNPLSPLLDAGYLEQAIRRHFAPLLDPAFDELLRRHYAQGIVFEIDGEALTHLPPDAIERATIPIRLGRKRLPSAIATLERIDEAAAARDAAGEPDGIAVSTFGKVIRSGWDWLGLSPSSARVRGLVEAPDLAGCLTLSKNDFVRTGSRGATYLAYRKAIQEVVSRQLAAWGDGRDADARPRTVRIERDLERVLEDLADDFPLLRSLVNQRPGGQKRLPMPGRGDDRAPGPLFANADVGDAGPAATPESTPQPGDDGSGADGAEPESSQPPVPPEPQEPPVEPPAAAPSGDADLTHEGQAAVGTFATVPGRKRLARYGLMLQFESRPDDHELGRLVESTIWINEAHPAFIRASASRSSGYHIALTVALALAPLAVGASDEHAFVTQFLAHWGGASKAQSGKRRRAKG